MSRSRWDPERLRAAMAVYLVAGPEQTGPDLLAACEAALANGATCLQLRAKELGGHDQLALALQMREMAHAHDALFVVNDRVDVAVAAKADGVHVGVSDLPLEATRAIVGPDLFVGYSPYRIDDVAAAAERGADYVGLGPVFATGSKADADPPIGLDGLADRAAAAALPTVGIGGITVGNAGDVVRAGADGVAVISAILRAPDPGGATAGLAAEVVLALSERLAAG